MIPYRRLQIDIWICVSYYFYMRIISYRLGYKQTLNNLYSNALLYFYGYSFSFSINVYLVLIGLKINKCQLQEDLTRGRQTSHIDCLNNFIITLWLKLYRDDHDMSCFPRCISSFSQINDGSTKKWLGLCNLHNRVIVWVLYFYEAFRSLSIV